MCRLPLPLLLFLLCSRAKAGEGIIGGPKSKPHSRPCMAHLETVTPQDKLPARGGFLIRRGFVRTAAHCAGSSRQRRILNPLSEARDQTLHRPTWETVPGAGWRRTTGEESASRTLQEGKLRLVEPQACRHFTAFDYSLQLCVGNPQKAKPSFPFSVLRGTPGPLVCNNVAQGIVSYGRKDGTPPRACTKVSSFLPWIKKIMKSL
uniref:Peptidase S1 domain-containing protein n=1 Tax=Sus scrofa TaxID=9823 RepID=A0A8D0PHH3_PIG